MDVRPCITDGLCRLAAIHVRHLDVHRDGVVLDGLDRLEGLDELLAVGEIVQAAPYILRMVSKISALSALSSAQRKRIPLSTDMPSLSGAASERTRPTAISRFERKNGRGAAFYISCLVRCGFLFKFCRDLLKELADGQVLRADGFALAAL